MSLMQTPEGMVAEALWHISCVLVDEMEPRQGKETLREESIDHLMQAAHSLALSFMRVRGIC